MHNSIANRLYETGVFNSTIISTTQREKFITRLERYEARTLERHQIEESQSHMVPKKSRKAKRRLSMTSLQRQVDTKCPSRTCDFDMYVKEIMHPEVSPAENRLEPSASSPVGKRPDTLSKGAVKVKHYDKEDFDSYVVSMLKRSNVSRSPESIRFDNPAKIDEISMISDASCVRSSSARQFSTSRNSHQSNVFKSPEKIQCIESIDLNSRTVPSPSIPSQRRLSLKSFPKLNASEPSDFNWLSCRRASCLYRWYLGDDNCGVKDEEKDLELPPGLDHAVAKSNRHGTLDVKKMSRKRQISGKTQSILHSTLWGSLRQTSSDLVRVAREQNAALSKYLSPRSRKYHRSFKQYPRNSSFKDRTETNIVSARQSDGKREQRQLNVLLVEKDSNSSSDRRDNISSSTRTHDTKINRRSNRSPESTTQYTVTRDGSPEVMQRLKLLWGCHNNKKKIGDGDNSDDEYQHYDETRHGRILINI